jgi:hypothetical protein
VDACSSLPQKWSPVNDGVKRREKLRQRYVASRRWKTSDLEWSNVRQVMGFVIAKQGGKGGKCDFEVSKCEMYLRRM